MVDRHRRHRVLFVLGLAVLLVGSATVVTASPSPPALTTPSSPVTTAVAAGPTARHGVWGDFVPPIDADLVVTQPDGSTFRARLTPAELGADLEVGGFTVVKGSDGWWRYAARRGPDGLEPTDALVGIDDVPAELPVGVGRVPNIWDDGGGQDARSQFLRQLQVASRAAQMQAAQAGEPRLFRFPVLMLATWWDEEAGQTSPQFQPGSDTAEHFQALLDGFGGNPRGTLTEFYFENSHGQFLVQVDVFGPYTSVRSVQDPCYYGDIDPPPDPLDDLDPTDSVLGVGGVGVVGMAIEAVPQADPEVDFAAYDNDGDDYVDFVGIIHSGADMAVTGDPCHTWSHALPVSAFGAVAETILGLPADTVRGGVPTADGVLVDRLFTMPEFDQPGGSLQIGVATHEMAHALGEPDYYAVNGSSSGDGDWDIMSGGSYLGNPDGSNPPWFNPASRVFQGWMTPTIVHDDQRDVALAPRSAPLPGYTALEPNPNVILVPTKWIEPGDTDELGHTWTDIDVYGLVRDGEFGYVIEGYYLEFASRMAQGAPIHDGMTRAAYFDRGLHGSGLLTWHFDYWRRSNVYFGDNDGQNDPNRMQMDVEEWDENDNTQEIALNLHRGEASDLAHDAATGITSGGHANNPNVPDVTGDPQAPIDFSGTAVGPQTSDFEFVVEGNPANYTMTVRAGSSGDCTLQLLYEGEEASEVVDSGGPGGQEEINVTQPDPGTWTARVGDFLGCLNFTGRIEFSPPTGFDSTGTGDTWSNWTESPTGWAFTNIRTGGSEGMDFGADAGGANQLVLDIVNLGADEIDVSPGFAKPAENAVHGGGPVNVGADNEFAVPIFSNGGGSPGSVGVSVHEGSPSGPTVAQGTVDLGAYARRDFEFTYRPTEEGGYDLYTVLDAGDALDEAHETNNVQKTSGWAGPEAPVVLIVDDDGAQDSEDMYAGALAALGIPYAIAERHVDAATMAAYEAVIWTGAVDRGPGQLDEDDQTEMAAYLDGGGDLWLSSNRAIGALEVMGDDAETFAHDYFGAATVGTDTITQPFTAVGTGDLFGTARHGLQPYPIRPFVDQLEVAASPFGTASGLLTMADSGKPDADGSLLGIRLDGTTETGTFRSIVTTFNLAEVSNPDSAVQLTRAVMDHFAVAGGRYAVDSDEPVVYHSGIRFQVSNRETPVRAFVLGGDAGEPASLYFRRHALGLYHTASMVPQAEPGSFLASIPANAVTPDGVDYYLRAGSASTFDPRAAADDDLVHAIAVAVPEVANPIGILEPEIDAPAPAPAAPAAPPEPQSAAAAPTLPATGAGTAVETPLLLLAVVLAARWASRRITAFGAGMDQGERAAR